MFSDYWASSISYMIAMAIMESVEFNPEWQGAASPPEMMPYRRKPGGFKQIDLLGIHMKASSDYTAQRANLEYFLGMLRPLGISLGIPDESALLKIPRRYGAYHGNNMARIMDGWIKTSRKGMAIENAQAEASNNAANQRLGEIRAFEMVKEHFMWDEEMEKDKQYG